MLRPQQSMPPPESNAHGATSPVLIAVASLMPLTATGVALFSSVPSPSTDPSKFSPQQSTPPVASSAHIETPPAPPPIAIALVIPLILLGVGLFSLLPSTNAPSQHSTLPSASKAHVPSLIAATAVALVIPGTGTGTELRSPGPSLSQMSPQHSTEPPEITAHV